MNYLKRNEHYYVGNKFVLFVDSDDSITIFHGESIMRFNPRVEKERYAKINSGLELDDNTLKIFESLEPKELNTLPIKALEQFMVYLEDKENFEKCVEVKDVLEFKKNFE